MFEAIRNLTTLGNEVHVVSFADARDDAAQRVLRANCSSLELVTPPRLWQLRGLVTDPPLTLARYVSRDMERRLRHTALSREVDIVELETLHMAAYGGSLRDTPRILRPQNAEHRIWERYAAASSKGPAAWLLRRQAQRVRRFEARAIRDFVDATLAVSNTDAAALRAIAPDARVDVLPMGIDVEEFSPMRVDIDGSSIVITGSFEWAPKRQNLLALVDQVFPLIKRDVPDAKLLVVGRGLTGAPLQHVRAVAGVRYVGPVPDVRPYIARAAVVINYVQSGSGIAIKILEAMAMGKAIVSNDLGVEGIEVRDDVHLLIAGDPVSFANAVARSLADQALRTRLGLAARRLVEAKYSARILANDLAGYMRDVVLTVKDGRRANA